MIDCISKTTKTEGVLAFYRGCLSPLVLTSVERGLQFHILDLCKKSDIELLNSSFISGALAGGFGPIISCPMNVIKINMQNSTASKYQNVFHCIKHIYQSNRILGFYKGYKVNIILDMFYGSVYFGTIEFLNNYQKKIRETTKYFQKYPILDHLSTIFKGGIAGCIGWGIILPLDSLKTFIQSGLGFDAFKNNIHNYGIRYMWRGITPVMIRAFPVHALSIASYDYVKSCIQ